MTEELKFQIVAGVKDYAHKKNLSNNDVAKLSMVNPAYISVMFKNVFTSNVGGKEVPIGDKWFYRLAEWAGFDIRKQYWHAQQTTQFTQIIPSLEQAKKSSKVAVLIAPTGTGKTYAVDKFCKLNPLHTYKITVSDVHRLPDIIRELCDKMGVPHVYGNANKLAAITDKMQEVKRSGFNPIIIIDEAENLRVPVLRMLKGLYDGINLYCSLTLVGTPALIHSLQRMKKQDVQGMPQFFRRVKAGIRYLDAKLDFKMFLDRYVPEDKGLRKLLMEMCDNYGELHDYLEPALREADEQGVELTEHFFRIMYNLPKYQ